MTGGREGREAGWGGGEECFFVFFLISLTEPGLLLAQAVFIFLPRRLPPSPTSSSSPPSLPLPLPPFHRLIEKSDTVN